jgi:hypothetical protein
MEVVHGQLFLHLDVGDARGERRDDLLIGDPWNLVPHLAETLDVLSKRLALVLTHRLEVILHGEVLIRWHEIGNELSGQILPRANGLVGKVHEPSSRCFSRPVVPLGCCNGHFCTLPINRRGLLLQ